ncbi:hypothetical protein LCGC14_1740000 [marine sediment metagenome]|uniref:Uncharacterized protein n=1 Tax=marine sediment metagenome TaxID=412755 RepID=A0A0F9H728_9ZZZZ
MDKCKYLDCEHNFQNSGMCEVLVNITDCDKRSMFENLSNVMREVTSLTHILSRLQMQNQKSKETFISDIRQHLEKERHKQIWHMCNGETIRTYSTLLCSCCRPSNMKLDEKIRTQDFSPYDQIMYLAEELKKYKEKEQKDET